MANLNPNPTSADHLAWAKQNEQFFNAIRVKWPDWAIIVLFYVAVHEVQAFLIDSGHRPKNHTDRDNLLKQYWLPTIWPPYESLKQGSTDSRYDCWMPDPSDINDALLRLAQVRAVLAQERAVAGI